MNIKPYKNRTVADGDLVRVYRNLNNNSFSVVCAVRNIVLAHVTECQLTNVTYVVSEKGRQRVIKDKRKNVHAYIQGHISFPPEYSVDYYKPVKYNPYKDPTFMCEGEPIHNSTRVVLLQGKDMYASIQDKSIENSLLSVGFHRIHGTDTYKSKRGKRSVNGTYTIKVRKLTTLFKFTIGTVSVKDIVPTPQTDKEVLDKVKSFKMSIIRMLGDDYDV